MARPPFYQAIADVLARGALRSPIADRALGAAFLCASIVAPTGLVFAFESNPKFADMLRRSKTLNAFGDIIQVEQRALYSVTGEKQRFFLSVNPMNTGMSSLSDPGSLVHPAIQASAARDKHAPHPSDTADLIRK